MRGSRPEAALEEAVASDGVLARSERLVVACSGGADSVALAALLAAVRDRMALTLRIAYVHHGTRESAWQDECVVLRTGAALGIPVNVLPLTLVREDEQSLREARYEALVRFASETESNAIATAHHAEDQSETVLMALFRGAGPDGLAGMPARRRLTDEITLVRPLLRVAAGDLRYYCHVQALPYAVDPGNADAEIRRNAVRQALTALRPLFPGLDRAVARAATLVGEERSGDLKSELRRRVRSAIDEQEGLRDVDFTHVEAVVRALERGGSGRFHMKPGVEIEIDRGSIAVVRTGTTQ